MLEIKQIDRRRIKDKEIKKQLKVLIKAYSEEMNDITGEPKRCFNCSGYPIFVVAVDNNEVIGFCNLGYQPSVKEVWINHCFVTREKRGRGVYQNMLKTVEIVASNINYTSIVVGISVLNNVSYKSHTALGFTPYVTMLKKKI